MCFAQFFLRGNDEKENLWFGTMFKGTTTNHKIINLEKKEGYILTQFWSIDQYRKKHSLAKD